MSGIVGPANESCITIEDKPTVALLDTGSQVSCVSETFYNNFLSHLELRPLNTLLKIEGAGGTLLPYSGYINAQIVLPGHVIGGPKSLSALFLVTNDTNFNKTCPILIGTNIISSCLSMQENSNWEKLPSAWKIAFQCIEMKFNDDVQGLQLHVSTPQEILPNSSLVVECKHNGLLWDDGTSVLVESSNPPGGLIVTYDYTCCV